MEYMTRDSYKNTYQRNLFVGENEFRMNKGVSSQPVPTFAEVKDKLPSPQWAGHENEIKMYWKTWELAFAHIRRPSPESGFSSSYIDTAYNGNMFMWDSVFMTLFTKYAQHCFDFQSTLNNFYQKQHPDGFICREITDAGKDAFHRYDPVSTGPDIFSWSERNYFESFGDTQRLYDVFAPLCAYHQWLRNNRTWKDGSYWTSGWGSGMDNIPRVPAEYHPNYSHGFLSWLDTTLQQYIDGTNLLHFGFILERWQEIEDIESELHVLKQLVQEKMWDDQKGFLFDITRNADKIPVMHIGAFWALHTDILTQGQIAQMAEKLASGVFFSERPVPAIQIDHPKFRENGRYWQGGVWAPTNYMICTGLQKQGYSKLAHELALKHIRQVTQVFKSTGTFWEYYSPTQDEPGVFARPDFVGWTGLSSISMLIEGVFGIRANKKDNIIKWDIGLQEDFSLRNYPYGNNGNLSFQATCKEQEVSVVIESNCEIVLEVAFQGKQYIKHIKKGKTEVALQEN